MSDGPKCPECDLPFDLPGYTVCRRCTPSAWAARLPAVPPPGRHFGDYELIEELASGGMGIVYLARQASLGRLVALKLLLRGRLAGELEVRRFRREAKAVAALQHPNIVTVHEFGEHEGQPFFSMELIDGPSLADVLRDGPLLPQDAAQLMITVAEAVGHAHARGVVHRDLKPANILLDRSRQPKVTDFGLAKPHDGTGNLTESDDLVGTLNYVAPEVLAEGAEAESFLSDQFSLGVTLYECLTGRPPFLGATPAATIYMIQEVAPIPPRLLNRSIPRDLETICLKCLEKTPVKRYAGAGELADDLRRLLSGEPVEARRTWWPERVWKWCARQAALSASLAALLMIGVVAATTACLWQQESTVRRTEVRNRKFKQALESRIGTPSGGRFKALAMIPEVLAYKLAPEERNSLATEAIATLIAADLRPDMTNAPPTTGFVCFSPDATEVITVERDGKVAIVYVAGPPTQKTELLNTRVDRLFVMDDAGQFLALRTQTQDGVSQLGIWQRSLGNMSATNGLSVPGYVLGQPSFGNERRWVAFFDASRSGGADSSAVEVQDRPIRIHDLVSGNLVAALATPGVPTAVVLDPRRPRCVLTSSDPVEGRTVRVIDVGSGVTQNTLSLESSVHQTAWQTNGLLLAGACADGRVFLWEPDSNRPPRLIDVHQGAVRCVAFSHDGQWFVTSGADGTVCLTHTATGRVTTRHAGVEAFTLRFSEDDRWVTGCDSNSTTAWRFEVVLPQLVKRIPSPAASGHDPAACRILRFSPDSQWLASNDGQRIGLWEAEALEQRFQGQFPGAKNVYYDEAGTTLLVATRRGLVPWTYHSDTIQSPRPGRPAEEPARPECGGVIAYSATGDCLAIVENDRVGFYHASGNTIWARTGPLPFPVAGLSLAPDGQLAVVIDGAGIGTIWNTRSGEPVRRLKRPIRAAWFSPASSILVVRPISTRPTLECWNLATRAIQWSTNYPGDFAEVGEFTPDGRWFATRRNHRQIQFVRMQDGGPGPLLPAAVTEGTVLALAFSPDQRRLAIARNDGMELWDLLALKIGLGEIGLGDWPELAALGTSPNSNRVSHPNLDPPNPGVRRP